jgi:hypothetical protein
MIAGEHCNRAFNPPRARSMKETSDKPQVPGRRHLSAVVIDRPAVREVADALEVTIRTVEFDVR